jgi:hypothetical protein
MGRRTKKKLKETNEINPRFYRKLPPMPSFCAATTLEAHDLLGVFSAKRGNL